MQLVGDMIQYFHKLSLMLPVLEVSRAMLEVMGGGL